VSGSRTAASESLVVSFDPKGFRELMKAAGQFDKVLTRNLRRDIRTAGKGVMSKVADAVRSGSYANDTGLREGIARGLRLQIATTTRQAGVRIVSTGQGLTEGKQRMANVWEHDKFRHPVFADREVWVDQAGHRYFFKTVYDNRGTVTAAVEKSMRAAAAALGAEIR